MMNRKNSPILMELKEFRETGGPKTSRKKKLQNMRNGVRGTNRLPGQRNEGGITYSGGVNKHSGRTEHLKAEDDLEETGGVAGSALVRGVKYTNLGQQRSSLKEASGSRQRMRVRVGQVEAVCGDLTLISSFVGCGRLGIFTLTGQQTHAQILSKKKMTSFN